MTDKPDSELTRPLQLDLIKLIKEQGLDPDNIFTGLIIGFEAGIADLLEQANKVIQVIAKQVRDNDNQT